MTCTLGLDVGTQGTKGLVIDETSGCVVARASRSYDLIAGLAPGAAEQDPRTWRAAVRDVIAELLADPAVGAIEAVAVSGQQHGCVLLGEDDEPVRAAKLWCDTETADEAAELGVPTGFTASKVLWTRRREPELWARTRRVLLPHDYINLLLTGVAAMESGDASGTGFFDVAARDFDAAALARLDALSGDGTRLAERLPRLDPAWDGSSQATGQATGKPMDEPGSDGGGHGCEERTRDAAATRAALALEPVGRVTAAAAAEFGLDEGTLVARGGGDNMMSALGSGATRAGVVVVSLGTSGTAFAHSDAPVVDPEGLIAPFCGSAGGWLPLLCVMNLTGVTEAVLAGAQAAVDLARAVGDTALAGASDAAGASLDHAAMTAAARAVPAGCDGLLWLPYLAGERVPDLPRATGTLLGMRPGHLRPGVLYRAALEGTSLNLAWGVARLAELGVAADEVRLVGGAANNALWREVLAACLDAPVTVLEEPESGALGAALQALGCARQAIGAEVDLHQLAEPFVRSGATTRPEPRLVSTYAELGARFRAEVARHYV